MDSVHDLSKRPIINIPLYSLWARGRLDDLTMEERLVDDTTRLEWLVIGVGRDKAARVMGNDKNGWSVCDCSNGLTFMSRGCPSFRAAIDEAMMKHSSAGEKP